LNCVSYFQYISILSIHFWYYSLIFYRHLGSCSLNQPPRALLFRFAQLYIHCGASLIFRSFITDIEMFSLILATCNRDTGYRRTRVSRLAPLSVALGKWTVAFFFATSERQWQIQKEMTKSGIKTKARPGSAVKKIKLRKKKKTRQFAVENDDATTM